MVEKQLKKVDNLGRENLLQYNTKKQNNRVPLVITYSKPLPNIHEILNFEKRSVWINPFFILILTSKNSICCEEKRNSVLMRGRRTEIKTQLRKRGYINDMVEKQLKKVDNLDRENLLQYNIQCTSNIFIWNFILY
jgi:hypothetical protein